MAFTFLTIAIPFATAHLAEVDDTLSKKGKETACGGHVRAQLRNQGVHFLSITTVPGDTRHDAFLVIESSHDVDTAAAIKCLATQLAETLLDVFEVAGIKASPANLIPFLKDRSIETGLGLLATPGLNHRGVPGMTVKRILQEHVLAEAVREMIAKSNNSASALAMLKDIRQRVENDHVNMLTPGDMSFLAPAPEPLGFLSLGAKLVVRGLWTFAWPYLIVAFLTIALVALWVWYSWGLLLGLGIGLLTLISAVLVLAAIFVLLYFRLRAKEKTDEPDDSSPDYDVLGAVKAIEDDGDVNHLAAISVMKPGLLRKLTLRLAFWVISQLAQLQFRPGFLGDLGTIHAARWVLLPETNKLLFFSNYSGSWESYLEDFITKAAEGLTAVWSNTCGYPRSTNLFFEGAVDGDRFKRWARRQQRPSHFWYRAYPNKTAHLARLNATIRHGLISASTENEAAEWLALFGSRVRRPASIEIHEVQSILFGGMRRLHDATCYLLRLPEDAGKSRKWLKQVALNITFGDRPPSDSAQIIAFTQSGLVGFGKEGVLAEFPAAFRQGMSAPLRAKNVLKDTGDDDPKKWTWGHGAKRVDAALLIYAAADGLESSVAQVSANSLWLLKQAGGCVVAQINTRRLPMKGPIREAFGFVDGVSQPIIRGTPRWTKDKNSQHLVEPGEFILGYPDNRGFLPSTPTIPSTADPKNLLPAHRGKAVERDWPDFSRISANTPRDIGRNSSYLVIRQMEQNVKRFDQRVAELAKELQDHPCRPEQLTDAQFVVWLKSKLVGRWPDGTSLVRYPLRPGTGWPQGLAGRDDYSPNVEPDNSFLLGSEDPEGFSCPFGAHIRRTNPRESFEPGSTEQLAIVNRHRILRIGRPYGPEYQECGDIPRGLLFMCLNGDLERQFEFIQQTWVMSRLFHGLSGEVDAIIGRGKKGGRLTIPTPQGPMVIAGLEDIITVRGGAYFFLPSRSAIRYLHTTDD